MPSVNDLRMVDEDVATAPAGLKLEIDGNEVHAVVGDEVLAVTERPDPPAECIPDPALCPAWTHCSTNGMAAQCGAKVEELFMDDWSDEPELTTCPSCREWL